jgi:signal peptidase I
MADALVGTHRDITCPACGRRFVCGADEPALPGKRAVCPNCGSADQELDSVPSADGDRLLVHRAAFLARSPRRWELAAFRDKNKASQVFVKRIAGLPGETIEIRAGDVYADGQIQRKSLAEFRGLAILVHDASFQPAEPGLPDRWQGEPGSTQWTGTAGKYVCAGKSEQGTGDSREKGKRGKGEEGNEENQSAIRNPQSAISTDWLVYRHWRRRPGRPHETEEIPIDDGYGYNQTRPVVESYPVRDLLLTCKLRTSGSGCLALFATDGQSELEVEIEPATHDCKLFHDGKLVATAVDLTKLDSGEFAFELALVDRQLLLAIDGRTVLAYPYSPSDRVFRPTPRPFGIGSQGLGIEVSEVKLYRDVYYTPPRYARAGRQRRGERESASDAHALIQAEQAVQYRLADGEYFVLGDNSPLSLDSRDWAEGPGVSDELLLGKPIFVHYASRSSAVTTWGFQVPDLTRIGYIR